MREILKSTNISSLLRLTRRALGFFFLVIGLLGAAFPIIPGWPALLVAILLLGRRDRTLRLMHLLARRILRWSRTTQITPVRRFGRWLSDQYLGLRRVVTPRLIAAERTLGW